MSEVRWEPVEQAGLIDGRGDVLKIRTTGDGAQSVYAESDDGWVWMPDAPVKYRLCRAKQVAEAPPAPAWSQEPPNAPGRLWVWHENVGMTFPYAVGWEIRHGEYVFVFPNGETQELSGMPAGTWYMPATVPPPPVTP